VSDLNNAAFHQSLGQRDRDAKDGEDK
jgi:hypothetical protein